MTLHFYPISLDQQEDYITYFDRCPVKASDYSFINLWAWAEEYHLSWAFRDSLVWIRQSRPELIYWAPIGDWAAIDWRKSFAYLDAGPKTFKRIPEKLLDYWQATLEMPITIEETRGDWDYLYNLNDLIELKGNRYHKKKNLVNQFTKNYTFEYISLGAELIEQAKNMQVDWCTWRDCESSDMLAAENRVIDRILGQWQLLRGLDGGALSVDGHLVAYTLAEVLKDGIIIVHFEKGNPEFKGCYQMINQTFLEAVTRTSDPKISLDPSPVMVNREQDLDIEGLRKSKLSYHPAGFIKKNKVVIQA